MNQPKIEIESPRHVKLCSGWQRTGHPDSTDLQGVYFGRIMIEQWWAMVLWDDEEDPDFFKFAGLQFLPESEA